MRAVRRPFWPRAVAARPPLVGPSQVGTSDSFSFWAYPSLFYQYNRKVFSAAGREWIFYADSTGFNVSSSTDGGVSWDTPAQLFAFVNDGENPGYTDFHFDGTYLHYAYGGDMSGPVASPLRYRRGEPQTDGSMSWSAAEQTITTAYANPREVGVWTDSDGRPFVSFESELNDARVAWTDSTDGTWTNASGSPAGLLTGDTWWTNVVRLDQSGAMMAFVYRNNSDPLYGVVWDGAAWGTPVELTEGTWFAQPYGVDLATASDPNTGRAWAWWTDSAGGYMRQYESGAWGSVLGPFSFDTFQWGGSFNPRTTFSLAVDGDGLLHIFYADPSGMEMRHSSYDGSVWATPDILFAFPGVSGLQPGTVQVSSVALNGEFVIAYEDEAGGIWGASMAAPAYTLTTGGGGGGPTTVTLTPATSANAAQALAIVRSKTLTPAAETGAAQPLSWTRFRTLTPTTETDSAVALQSVRAATLTPAGDTSSAVALSRLRVATLTSVLEADSAIALTKVKSVTLTPVGDVAGAQPITFRRVATLTPAGDSSSAQAITAVKFATLGVPVETDTAVALSTSSGTSVTLTPVTEVDSAQAITATKVAALAPAVEIDSAVAVSFTHGSGTFVTLTPAVEADGAQPLSWTRFRAITAAVDTSSAVAITAFRSMTVTPVVSTNTAVAVGFRRFATLTPALEIGTAVPLVISGPTFRSLTPATDSSAAVPLAWVRFRVLTPAGEVDTAMPITLGAGGLPQTRRALAGRIGRAAGGEAMRGQPGRILRGITGRIR